MQLVQTTQFKGALGNGRVPASTRNTPYPISLTGVTQRSPLRHKPTRLLRAVKANFLQPPEARQKVPVDDITEAWSSTGSSAFYQAQEEASRRIALRLHDESGQMLALIYLQLAGIARDCPDSTAQKINLVVKQLDGIREQLRGMSHELSPPILDQLGLMPALQSLANGVRDRSGLKMLVSGNVASLPRLVGVALYRVVQEALSNVVRHAKATKAEVRLSVQDNRILCTVSDDGIGFGLPVQYQQAAIGVAHVSVHSLVPGSAQGPVYGLGLTGIHERVTALKGLCRISSCQKGGMQLQVEIPL